MLLARFQLRKKDEVCMHMQVTWRHGRAAVLVVGSDEWAQQILSREFVICIVLQ